MPRDGGSVDRDGDARRLGGIDVLVSNVGGQIRRPGALEFTDEDWQREIDLNLLAAVRLDRALVPAMLEQGAGGAIVHVSSGAARIARSTSLHYSATKAALNHGMTSSPFSGAAGPSVAEMCCSPG